ncbi:Uma2 family endonuclease [Pannus brasiliensis CCIBt3594]|uniref:Uma2 family endonuclease n=1 Tax=Pannus brasiliensis CCIBt3594 TaxID=1427578 RepID=A0AAW9R0H0_9CHRO
MSVSVPIQSIELTPGSCISIDSLSWRDYETFLAERGERRYRVAYYRGTLEIVSPLPLHERPHRLIADIVKTILDFQGRDWEDFGATTFRRIGIAGVEPDTCFYIENADRVRSCLRMDLTIDPPPDLAIESDVTSKTTLDAYLAIAVPEVWVYSEGRLKIYLLDGGEYREGTVSRIFPDFDLCVMIPRLVNDAMERGTRTMLRELKESLNRSEV